MYDVRQDIKDMRANISDCIHTLRACGEKDSGIYKAIIGRDENPCKLLLGHLIASLDCVGELSDWINQGAPDQR